MAPRRRIRLRPLAADERAEVERVARSGGERADRVARAEALLAVAEGAAFTEAARAGGRRAGDAVAHLVERFNTEGVAALDRRYGGGPPVRYGPDERERILREVRRRPDREEDRTGTWSLTTLQQALRRAPDGLPMVSTATILHTLWEAGYTWQRDRSWCATGTAKRKRKDGSIVETVDPDAAPKKS
jgi:transposase